MVKLANILKTYRRQHRMLQKEVASAVGISREHYAQIETGHVSPSFRLLQRLTARLDLNLVVNMRNGTYQFRRRRQRLHRRGKTN